MMWASDVALAVPGGFSALFPRAVALDLAPMSQVTGRRFEAVLGNDLLRHMVVEIDSRARSLRFTAARDFAPPEGAQPLALLNNEGLIEIEAAGHPLRVSVDLGYNGHLRLTPEAWGRVAPAGAATRRATGINGEGIPYATQAGELALVSAGSVRQERVPVTIGPVNPERGDGLIGLQFLLRHRVVLDVAGRRMWLLPQTATTSGRN